MFYLISIVFSLKLLLIIVDTLVARPAPAASAAPASSPSPHASSLPFSVPSAALDAVFIYTSGTTGRPKGVRVRHSALLSQVTGQVAAWGWRPADCITNVLPLHHVHGFANVVCTALWVGARLNFLPKARSGFDPAAQWDAWTHAANSLSQSPAQSPSQADAQDQARSAVKSAVTAAERDAVFGRQTLFMAVPTIYDHLVRSAPAAPAAATAACAPLRLMVSGSMALPATTLARWRALSGHTLLERYGMTEIGMALTNPLDPAKRVPGAVGKPFPGVQVRIRISADADADVESAGKKATDAHTLSGNKSAEVDAKEEDDADPVAWGPGELLVRGPSVFRAYWRRDDATAEAFESAPEPTSSGAKESEPWFLTGDVVSVSRGGVWRILGRASVDILKVSGFKVSALDVERTLLEHPGIREVAVLGLPSDAYGQTIAAVVVPNHDAAAAGTEPLDLAALREWAAPRMARYKLPRALWLCDQIPRNAMGKVNKKHLAKIFPRELDPENK